MRALFVVLLLAAPASAQGVAPVGTSLRVVSYNVHGLPSFITGDDTPGRLRQIGPRLDPFDVVGLQEDFIDDGHRHLFEGRPHGTRLRFDAVIEGRVQGSGLSLLARPRAVATHTEHFRTFAGVLDGANDGLASKGLQLTRLELAPGVEVDVWNTHMDAGNRDADREARADQVRQALDALRARSAGRAVLFLGDTNLNARGDAASIARLLEGAGLRCACAAARLERCCGRIDRILLRSGAGVELTPVEWSVSQEFVDAQGRQLSDHAPVVAVIGWRRVPL
jgi:endonuclease/exonuclease/phosphatase family metal-dependent hydrolase